MRKKDRKAALAALKCETIIDGIKKSGCQADVVAGKRTTRGEQRIKNCVKYNLGAGYRLITIRVGCHLLAPFAGTHDETDKWLTRHRFDDFVPNENLFRCERIDIAEIPEAGGPAVDESPDNDTDAYEVELAGRLDEACLRAVFRGLIASSSKKRSP